MEITALLPRLKTWVSEPNDFMSERYWITGVQLGMLRELDNIELIEEIIDKQFIGNYYTKQEQDEFIKKLSEVEE
jgi:hypothetical protein